MVTWQEKGFIVRVKKLSENDTIVSIFTRDHGCYNGVIKGGQSHKKSGYIQIGNYGDVQWKARLEKHLGYFTFDIIQHYASAFIRKQDMLHALILICNHITTLPERQSSAALYDVMHMLIKRMKTHTEWLHWFIYFEHIFLKESGFGLDLTRCAVTQSKTNLTYVSPRTGRAVTQEVGHPYRDKLFKLPAFLCNMEANVTKDDIMAGFTLMSYFLDKDIYKPLNKSLPITRDLLVEYIKKMEH